MNNGARVQFRIHWSELDLLERYKVSVNNDSGKAHVTHRELVALYRCCC